MKPYAASLPLREQIQKMHNDGVAVRQMCRTLGLDKSTVDYHRQAMGLVPKRQFKNRDNRAEDAIFYTTNHWLTRRWV